MRIPEELGRERKIRVDERIKYMVRRWKVIQNSKSPRDAIASGEYSQETEENTQKPLREIDGQELYECLFQESQERRALVF